MKIDFDLIKFICIIAIGASVISTPTIQKIKEMLKTKKYLNLIAFIVSFIIGELFTLSFSDLNWKLGMWVGFFTWLGAEGIYQAFENKLFTPFSDMNKDDEIVIDRDDIDGE